MTFGKYYTDTFQKWVDFTKPRVRNREEAEDIVQQLFVELIGASEKCKDLLQRGHMDAYMNKYCVLRARSFWGAGRIRRTEYTPENDYLDEPYERTPENECARTDLLQHLHRVIQKLPARPRIILRKHAIGGEPMRVVAKQINMSVSGARDREIEAIAVLRHFFRGCNYTQG